MAGGVETFGDGEGLSDKNDIIIIFGKGLQDIYSSPCNNSGIFVNFMSLKSHLPIHSFLYAFIQ